MGIDATMFVRTTKHRTTEEVRRLSVMVAEAFGPDSFWIFRPKQHGQAGTHALEIVSEFDSHDANPITPIEGEQFIEVHPATRYYGPGYERGDAVFLCALAEWLEVQFAPCSVWYAGDSSGCEAERFDSVARHAMMQHFIANGHRPYAGTPFDDEGGSREQRLIEALDPMTHDIPIPRCDFCKARMIRFMWGGSGLAGGYRCAGCGYRQETRDGGKTWAEMKDGLAF